MFRGYSAPTTTRKTGVHPPGWIEEKQNQGVDYAAGRFDTAARYIGARSPLAKALGINQSDPKVKDLRSTPPAPGGIDPNYNPNAPAAAGAVPQTDLQKYGYGYQNILNDDGTLRSIFKINPDISPWKQTQLQLEDTNRQNLLNNATTQGYGARANAETALAARGGLSSGARERLARSSMRDVNANRQGVNLQSNLNRLGIEATAQDKVTDINKWNIANQLSGVQMQNTAAQEKALRDLQAWAANRQALAIERAG